ncbi:MAG: UDP-N-acetylmuramoyl-tripeptide--D-alanyl-D-alanine ligase [Planctomycetia bacterium]
MEPIRYSDLLRATGGVPAGDSVVGDPLIPAVTIDGRNVPQGALFVPLRGKSRDGHEFLEQAFINGAGFALVARDAGLTRLPAHAIVVPDTTKALGDLARWHRSRFSVPVVGITGSCGKTTTKEMVRQVLGRDVVASPASYNNEIGVPLTLLQMDRRTRACVVEIGTNAPGEIAHLASIARPTVGIVTCVEEVHLEGLGSVRGVMEEKSALVRALPRDGVAIINADNYWCREMMERVDCHLLTYGTWEDSDIYGLDARATADGIAFYLYGKMLIEVPVMGLYNVANALAAVATGLWLGQSPIAVRDALAHVQPPPMRMAREVHAGVTLVNAAYNANPRAMDAALDELARRPAGGRRVAVLGEMLELGTESERHHRALGRKVAGARVDLLWAIGPSAAMVAEEAVRAGMPAGQVRHHASTADALAELAFEPRAGDTWLFKASRGMALERVLERVRAVLSGDEAGTPPAPRRLGARPG